METAGFRYSWRKTEVEAQVGAGWRQVAYAYAPPGATRPKSSKSSRIVCLPESSFFDLDWPSCGCSYKLSQCR